MNREMRTYAYTKQDMRDAFRAGFQDSAEGFNGEQHPEKLGFILRTHFDDWLKIRQRHQPKLH